MPLHIITIQVGQPVLAQLFAEAGTQGKSQHEVCVEKLESKLWLLCWLPYHNWQELQKYLINTYKYN